MSKELQIFSETPPSQIFKDCLHKSSSPQALCEACGRIHFNREQFISLDAEEIQGIKDDMESHPHLYIEHNTVVGISYVDIDGTQYVVDCECNKLRVIEESWWENQVTICEYIKRRGEKLREEARKVLAIVSSATDAVTAED